MHHVISERVARVLTLWWKKKNRERRRKREKQAKFSSFHATNRSVTNRARSYNPFVLISNRIGNTQEHEERSDHSFPRFVVSRQKALNFSNHSWYRIPKSTDYDIWLLFDLSMIHNQKNFFLFTFLFLS